MLKCLKKEQGGAMIAALLLMPVVAAGTMAAYQVANKSANVTLMSAMEEDAVFSSESLAESIIGQIVNNANKRTEVAHAGTGYILNTSDSNPGTMSRTGANPRYQKISSLYTVKKLPQNKIVPGAEANTIALEITTRTYNADSPTWNTKPYVERVTYQEFNMGIARVVGCAANYDIYAQNNYTQTQFFAMDWFKNLAYYAGNQWRSCGFSMPLSGWVGSSCVDAPDSDHGVKETLFPTCGCGLFGLACDYCQNSFLSGFTSTINDANCGATRITFENALYGNSDVNQDGTPDRDQIHRMNINGNDGNPYASNYPYPFRSMEKTIIDHISKNAWSATTHDAALAAMKADSRVSHIGNWYFRNIGISGIPDPDNPYFYFDGSHYEVFPFNMNMMRFRNSYIYYNGDMVDFNPGNGAMMNFGQIYLIASGNIATLNMVQMKMMDAGLVLMAGGSITNTSMMTMSGMNGATWMANDDIQMASGMKMSMPGRLRMLAGDDIISTSMMSGSFITIGNGSCGCTGGNSGESTEMGIGRRYSYSNG